MFWAEWHRQPGSAGSQSNFNQPSIALSPSLGDPHAQIAPVESVTAQTEQHRSLLAVAMVTPFSRSLQSGYPYNERSLMETAIWVRVTQTWCPPVHAKRFAAFLSPISLEQIRSLLFLCRLRETLGVYSAEPGSSWPCCWQPLYLHLNTTCLWQMNRLHLEAD